MVTRSAGFLLTAMTAVLLAGCGLGNRSLGSIFDSNSSGNAKCSYNDSQYADGSAICRSGRQYRCNDGRWKDLKSDCAQNAAAAASCVFDGRSYASGKSSCQSGTNYRCENGAWTNRGGTCGGGAAVQQPERSCRYNNVTVASQSTVCRAGKISRCENGRWHRLDTACQ